MPRPLHVVILAGGEGKRMKGPVTKVLVDLLGRSLIGHVLDAARPLRPRGVVVVGGRHLPAMRTHLADEPLVAFARQSKPLGTAHAVRQALRHLPERGADVLILCGDVPLIRTDSLRRFVAHHRRTKAAVSVASAIVPDPTGLGRIVRSAKGRLERIVEEKDATPIERALVEINAGLYVVRVEDLRRLLPRVGRKNVQREYYLTDLVALASPKSTAFALPDPEEARGINRPAEFREAYHVLRRRIFAEIEEVGAVVVDPATTHIEVGVRVAFGAVIHPFSVLRRGVSLSAHCVVGPFAHVRGAAEVGEGARVGSFVEVKASRLGANSRALHLSYLGDCRIGSDVNIGAGCITANHDGRRTHPTVISDGASLGAGTLLIAPVRVGRRARTGSGAVVTAGRDVPDDALFVGVPARPARARQRRGS